LRLRAYAVSGFAACLLGLASPGARADVISEEAQERERLRTTAPAAYAALRDGEAAVGAGDLAKAADGFARARKLAARSPLLARRHCEALAAAGRKKEALAACDEARTLGGGPLEMRAAVSAYLAGSGMPTHEDLAYAVFLSEQVLQRIPTLPHGHAARCEIARKIGDSRMLATCLETLRRMAPEHEETRRAVAAAVRPTPWATWAGFGLVALATLATLAHAVARQLRSRRTTGQPAPSVPLAVLAAVTGLCWLAAPAGAAAKPEPGAPPAAAASAPGERTWGDPAKADLGSIKIDDNNPEASVPTSAEANKNPLEFGYILQDLLARAEIAVQKKDHAAAVKYFRAVVKMVPDRSAGFSRLCEQYEKLGDIGRAVQACAFALISEGATVDDHVRFVRLHTTKKEPLTAKDRDLVQKVIDHLASDPKTQVVSHHVKCELALKLEDSAMLEQCTAALVAKAPNDPKTVSFQWSLAMFRKDRAEAERMIERAQKTGVLPEGVQKMRTLTAAKLGVSGPWSWGPRLGVGIVLLGVAIAAVVVMRSSRRGPGPRAA
jgi:tetratricopeptide (TPR) repeat protein